MKKSIAMSSLVLLMLVFGGISQQAQIESCPTKYQALAANKIVVGSPSGGIILFQIDDLDTRCYKGLRIFVHVMNDSYQTKPFTAASYITINAYHGIGSGSWNYYNKRFNMDFTSELFGFLEIPVIGEKTRIVIYGYNMPDVKLKVDVASYLVK